MASRVGKYLLFETLGEGAYGKVKLGIHEDTGEQTAVKIMDKSDIQAMDMTVNVRREIAIMKALKHKNIVNLRQVLTSANKLYIVMDLVTGGELFTKILNEGKLEENLARRYFQEMVCGIEYCHRRGVYHRDLKPENLLIDDASGSLKITDFGLSAMKKDDDLLHTQVGSPNYCAPEVIARAKLGYDGAMVDAWSCGIILFALCTGYLPFFDENTKNLFKMILRSEVKYPKDFPPGARNICERLLMKDPNERATLAEIKKHPWFVIDFQEDIEPISSQQPSKRKIQVSTSDLQDDSADAINSPQSNTSLELRSPPATPRRSTNEGFSTSDVEHPTSPVSETSKSEHVIPSEPPRPLEELGVRERIEWDITRYRAIFQLGNRQSLIASKSFRGELKRKQKTSDPKDVTLRAKSITGAWAVNLAQQLLVCDEDSEFTVSIEELLAFEELLDIWERRSREVENKDVWWDSMRAIDPKETSHMLILLRILEPRPIEPEVSEMKYELEAVSSPRGTSGMQISQTSSDTRVSNERTNSNVLDHEESVRTPKIKFPAIRRTSEASRQSGDNSQGNLADFDIKRESKSTFGLRDLGGKLFGTIIPQSGTLQFETKLPPPKALKVVGQTLMDQGAQVMMKRTENKLKCEKNYSGVGLVVSITAEENTQGKTNVTFKKARGNKLEKEFFDLYQSIIDKFEN